MSQYFRIINRSKEEWFKLGASSAVSVASLPIHGAGLLTLLAADISSQSPSAGSWAEDDIRIIGDRHPEPVYEKTRDQWRVKCDHRRETVKASGLGPVDMHKSTGGIEFGDALGTFEIQHGDNIDDWFDVPSNQSIWIKNRELQPGDAVLIGSNRLGIDGCQKDFVCKYLETIDSDYTEVTNKIVGEVEALVESKWVMEKLTDKRIEQVTTPAQRGWDTSLTEFATEGQGADKDIVIANKSEKEYLKLPGSGDFGVAITDPLINAAVCYLLFNSTQSSSKFTKLHNVKSEIAQQAISEYIKANRSSTAFEQTYKEDGMWDEKLLLPAAVANRMIADDFDFAGRWSGDKLTVGQSDSIRQSTDIVDSQEWSNIKSELLPATKRFIGEGWKMADTGPLTDLSIA
jgi:hypothetical protein